MVTIKLLQKKKLVDNTKFHFVFIIDQSRSMNVDKMKRAKNTLKSLVKKIKIGSTFSIISSGSSTKLHTSMDFYDRENGIFEWHARNNALKEIDWFEATNGSSDLEDSLKETTEVIKNSEDTIKRIFLISDGMAIQLFVDASVDTYASKLKISTI